MTNVSKEDVMIYSDGDIEDFIIGYLRNNENGEKEILNSSNNGAVFHNFISARENLLNWYNFKDEASVLEIGAGMGALTKFLCEKCKKVTAIEMSEKRAEIIRLRCNKNNNLTVLSENINKLEISEKFDYVLLIGVLEYAGIGKEGISSYLDMLRNAMKFLKSDGKLLIAIENRFGLKYWCGASEDHTGIPFDGISGYEGGGNTSRYNANGVRTFSQDKINILLDEVGLNYKRYYYPFPDYKFPSVIYSQDKIPSKEEMQGVKFTYPDESTLIADERKLYPEIIDNDCFGFFANSFLIEASTNILENEHIIFASTKRDYKEKYRVLTTIDNDYKVKKIPLFSSSKVHLKQSFDNLLRLNDRGIKVIKANVKEDIYEYDFVDYKRGDMIFREFLNENKFEKVLELINELRKNNILSSDEAAQEKNTIARKFNLGNSDICFGAILKEGYIDLTFVNSFYNNNKLYFFDQEWMIPNVPLNFILYRAITTAYGNEKYNISIKKLYDYIGITSTVEDIYRRFEAVLLNDMMEKINCDNFDKRMYQESLTLKSKITNQLKNKEAHIELLLQSERDLKTKVSQIENELNNKNVELNDKNIELNNKEGHIELLLQSERELERIKNSHSWRFMGYAWTIKNRIVPCGSKRRFVVKVGVKFVKHPIIFIKKLTPKRIGNCFYYLRREGVSGASSRLDECVIGNSNEKINLNITKVDKDKIYEVSDFQKLIFNKVENPKVSIIIPVYNQIHYTYACLKSILENSKNISYEVIIANDCSTDVTSEIDKFVENIQVITTEENLRFLRNCNNSAKYAKGEYILFLNNDTQVQENWLEPLVTLIESDDSIGMVGSKLVYPDGRLQEAGGIIWSDASGWNYGRLSDPQEPEFNYAKECDYISGASMMIKHSLWNGIGGFDERFAPAYYEDSDLAFEVRKHGYKVMLQPLSVVVHFEGVSNGTNLTSGQKAYQVRNCETFKEKWKEELQKQFKNGENVFVARDRSKDKKHILVVDHYVPHYDKDAGSRTVYQYLKLFVSMGYGVSFIGDNFYRHEPYTSKLQQMGIEVLYGSYYSKNWKQWVKQNAKHFDFVLLNRPHISEKYIDFLKENTNAKIAYYGHDLHFLRELREFELTGEEKLLKSSNEWKNKELTLMSKADTTLYPSDVEVGEIKKINNSLDVRRLPAYIMENSYDLKSIKYRKDLLFVGGFGHGPNIDGIVWFCENIFPKVIEKNPNIKLNIVGSKAPDKVLNLKSFNVNVLGFVSDEELEELYKECRVSVAPLRYGAGIKGKIIEAIANGIPVVTTTCGAEGIANDNNFIMVDDDCDKFAQDILALYENEELIEMNINKGFKFIEENYSAISAEKFIGELFK